MSVNKAKVEDYANKVYRGDLRRYKEKQKKDNAFTFDLYIRETATATKGKRIAPTSAQGKVVIDKCKWKCIICGKKYEDPDDFQIHHVNGDRSKTTTANLVLLCHSCHKKVHTHASSKLKDYKVNAKSRSPKKQQSLIDISFDSTFGFGSKKKSQKKKKDNDWGLL